MSRTSSYKLLYIVLLVSLTSLVVWLSIRNSRVVSFLAAIACLIPGRAQGWMWREFFRGQRLFANREWTAAQAEFESFLARLNRQPWLRQGIWLGWAVYTRNIEAMTWNNLGALMMNSGESSAAETALHNALSLDRLYPLPYWNLAVLRSIENRPDEAAEFAAEAQRLGYTGGTSDRLVREGAELLAQIEGRGRTKTR